jgi:hypothetical protein
VPGAKGRSGRRRLRLCFPQDQRQQNQQQQDQQQNRQRQDERTLVEARRAFYHLCEAGMSHAEAERRIAEELRLSVPTLRRRLRDNYMSWRRPDLRSSLGPPPEWIVRWRRQRADTIAAPGTEIAGDQRDSEPAKRR